MENKRKSCELPLVCTKRKRNETLNKYNKKETKKKHFSCWYFSYFYNLQLELNK